MCRQATTDNHPNMNRRTFLTTSGIALSASLAGCAEEDNADTASSDNAENTNTDTESDSNSDSGSDSDGSVKILDHELVVEDFSTSVQGRVENATGEDQSYIEVTATFYNANDERIDENFTNSTDVPDGEVVHFEVLFLGDDPDATDHYELETATSV